MIGAHLSLTHWSKHPWNDSTIVIKFIKTTIFIISLRFLFKVFKCLDFIKDLKDVQSNLNDTWCGKHFWQDYFEGRKKFLPISKIRRSLLSQHSLNNWIQRHFHHRNVGSFKIEDWQFWPEGWSFRLNLITTFQRLSENDGYSSGDKVHKLSSLL